jgi:CRISPR-associated protein Csb1
LALQYQQGYDLRARCFLMPAGPLQFDYLAPGSADAQPLNLDVAQTHQLLSAALQQAESHGLYWRREPIWLEPKPGLYELIRRSNAMAPGEEPPMDDASC